MKIMLLNGPSVNMTGAKEIDAFGKTAFDAMIDTEFGLRIWQGLALGITALRGFLKIRKSAKKEDDANEQRASTQADH